MKIIREIGSNKGYRCGCEFERLRIDGNVVMSGDYYYDKIAQKIDGFIEAIKYFKIKYTYKKKKIKCPRC